MSENGPLDPQAFKIMQSQAERWAHAPERWSLSFPDARDLTREMCRRWNANKVSINTVVDMQISNRHGSENRARLFVPDDADGSLIIYFHGGGWVVGDIDTHEGLTRQLASDCKSAVLSFDYRLAPEHPFPAGLEDCIDLWEALSAERLDLEYDITGPIAVAGDSAGANLAMGVILAALKAGTEPPDVGILFYGVFGRDFTTASYRDFHDGPGLTAGEMKKFWDWYLPDEAHHNNALAIPLLAEDELLSSCPKLFLGAACVDPLYSESRKMNDRLSSLGRDDVWKAYEGVPHGFVQMVAELPIAQDALKDAAKFFDEYKAS